VSYAYKDYWRDLHQREDLTAVGQSSLPAGTNLWIYRSIRRNLRSFVKRHKLTARGTRRMLEVGVGTGYWIDFWRAFGWTVDGCDLVPEAVERLRAAHPEAAFWAADVSSAEGVLKPSDGLAASAYDLVTATSVLLHVTADDAFDRALANVAAAVRPGGYLLLMEPALTLKKKQLPFNPEHSSRARVKKSYVTPLEAAGLELVTIEATTVLAANPLEGGSPRRRALYGRWWRLVTKSRQRPNLARVLGPAMYVGDAVLMRTKEMPTSKLLLFRRPVGR
jgi:SAM-dependent methyltransferase